ncbi:MAG: NAD(P)-dependent glycerol-1-phosphate dehydrogenase [Candidatus Thermoplasmatota archaeon]|jgi:glycerol-1-phosphate dehydrogenase [NAD(P)+]|nr:NAD(P)-dependent glycerol-1-phosphate dehydrogenase [Candidatus Thermoplasmatota archaeon]MCL5984334.1 NAD(P)-dependent glycerol-1-phosphate dehydrogenase [Candidatus Thermoplasmatota archaeon]
MAEGRAHPVFEKAKTMTFPRTVLAGHGVLSRVGEVATSLGLSSRCVLITGKTTEGIAGRQTAEGLKKEGFEVRTWVAGDPTLEEVNRLASEVRDWGGRFVVAVGGGSKIDIGKLVASQLKLSFISVPTAASHDGISSPRASLKGERESFSVEAAVPSAVVADTQIILAAPFRFLVAGCADVISNTTAVLDWRLAQRLHNEEFSSTAAALAEYAAREILEHASLIRPGSEESVWIAIRPIIMSGIAMAVAGTSRPSSGSEHLFAHALSRVHSGPPLLHGEAVGVGTIMMMYLHGGNWQQIQQVLKEIGAPTTAETLGVTAEEIITALMNAHTLRPERYTILGTSGLTREAAERLAHVTGVI